MNCHLCLSSLKVPHGHDFTNHLLLSQSQINLSFLNPLNSFPHFPLVSIFCFSFSLWVEQCMSYSEMTDLLVGNNSFASNILRFFKIIYLSNSCHMKALLTIYVLFIVYCLPNKQRTIQYVVSLKCITPALVVYSTCLFCC